MTQHAFDVPALSYDDDYTNTPIGRYLRGRVQERLLYHFSAGDSVLEMGCGTGEDARFLGEQGVNVLATDVSQAMLTITRAKTEHLNTVQTACIDLNILDTDMSLNQNFENELNRRKFLNDVGTQPAVSVYEKFDGAFASAGVLNCVTDLSQLAGWLASWLHSGARFAAGIMSPFCIWEMLWHGVHLDFAVATRRWRESSFQPEMNAPAIPVYYPTIRQVTAALAPYFRRINVMPLGVFLPPSDVFSVIEKRPRLLQFLTSLENRVQNSQWLARFADHYWIEFERTAMPCESHNL